MLLYIILLYIYIYKFNVQAHRAPDFCSIYKYIITGTIVNSPVHEQSQESCKSPKIIWVYNLLLNNDFATMERLIMSFMECQHVYCHSEKVSSKQWPVFYIWQAAASTPRIMYILLQRAHPTK